MSRDYDLFDRSLVAVSLVPPRTYGHTAGVQEWANGRNRSGVYPWPEGLNLWDKPAVARWTASVLRKIEAETGITGWIHDIGYGMLFHVPEGDKAGKRARPVWGLCAEWVHGAERGAQPHICGRPVDEADGEMCRMHRAAKTKRDENTARWHAEWDAERDADRRAELMTKDLRELWGRVCAQRDVMRPGDATVRRHGTAGVDAEVLMMLLRELDYEGGR